MTTYTIQNPEMGEIKPGMLSIEGKTPDGGFIDLHLSDASIGKITIEIKEGHMIKEKPLRTDMPKGCIAVTVSVGKGPEIDLKD